ncbi:MAG: LLM class flavin-dependent oxidoreductase [Dehalococcoidia bacterium]|nr:LLM class flavin-dependent oxidoreductase [Dehalococcoidia bacterium]
MVFIGTFTERPYQDPKLMDAKARGMADLVASNGDYNGELGRDLYHRYFDEKIYAEQMGFDGLMLNEHHSSYGCMGNAMNIEAAILARITTKGKIGLIGNILPIHDDPLLLAEQLAMIDVISGGRLITGWVRGTGRESVATDTATPYNWERYQEAHDLIKAAWTIPGPFRWEGDFFQYRYVNPWPRPFQRPHPPMFIPGALSRNTVKWAAEHAYTYIMLTTKLELTRQSLEYYREVAREVGYEAGPEHLGYMFPVRVDETEELAMVTGKKFAAGPNNQFIEGNQGAETDDSAFTYVERGDALRGKKPWERKALGTVLRNLPGMTQTNNLLPAANTYRGRDGAVLRGAAPLPVSNGPIANRSFEQQVADGDFIVGTPKTVLPQIRRVMETLRAGTLIFRDGDGVQTHEETMRGMRLMGEEIIPAVREMAKELGLAGPFDKDPQASLPAHAAAVARPAEITIR